MNELELRQIFKNQSDCYADTWLDIGVDMIQGKVIPAMTEDRFIETLNQSKLLTISDVIKCCNAMCDKDAIDGGVYCDFHRSL